MTKLQNSQIELYKRHSRGFTNASLCNVPLFCICECKTKNRNDSLKGQNRKMSNIFDLFKQIEKKSESENMNVTHIVVGLGNPGEKYQKTRHNVGFLTMDYIAEKLNVNITKAKYKALVCDVTLGGKRVLLMNRSNLLIFEAVVL